MKGQKAMFSKESDEWESPYSIVKEYAPIIHHDVCATEENTKCESFWSMNDDALSKDWNEKAKEISLRSFEMLSQLKPSGEDTIIDITNTVRIKPSPLLFWMNPPHSKVSQFVEKAYNETHKEDSRIVVVSLLPSRTDTRWFHNFVYRSKAKITFIKGRLRFSGSKNSAPFPSMIVEFGRDCFE